MIRLFIKTSDTIMTKEVASVFHGQAEWEDLINTQEVYNDDPDTNMVWVQDFENETVYEWSFKLAQWTTWRMEDNYEEFVEQIEEGINLLGPRP